MNTYFGYKQQLTQTWSAAGRRLPVTIVKVTPLTVKQLKTSDSDGYTAVSVEFGLPKTKFHRRTKEIRLVQIPENLKVGTVIAPDTILHPGDICQVAGITKGRGFAGVVKRHGFKGGPKTHGQSDRLRAPGSIGQGTDPGRVHKGKKMAGHYGSTRQSVKNIAVLKLDPGSGELWLKGPIPGAYGSLITLRVTGHTDPLLPELVDSQSSDTPAKPENAQPLPDSDS